MTFERELITADMSASMLGTKVSMWCPTYSQSPLSWYQAHNVLYFYQWSMASSGWLSKYELFSKAKGISNLFVIINAINSSRSVQQSIFITWGFTEIKIKYSTGIQCNIQNYYVLIKKRMMLFNLLWIMQLV